jgi:hypothetical protein
METVTQFTIALENKPGTLRTMCNKLAAQKVNIEAISVINTQEMGLVRMTVSNQAKAAKALKDFNTAKEEVLKLSLANRPGSLAEAAARLAAADVNIEYTYGSTGPQGNTVLIMKVADTVAAQKALG